MGLLVAAMIASTEIMAQAPVVAVGSTSASVGGQGVVELEALEIVAPGLGAWTIDVVYDPEIASVVECEADHGGVCNPAYAEDRIRVAGTSVYGLPGNQRLAVISFACNAVGQSDLVPVLRVLADATPGGLLPVDAAVQSGSISCAEQGVVPAPGPEPTDAPGELPGDANCDRSVNAIDAAVILQFDARLIGALPCEHAADVNEDGAVNAIDAAVILQVDAGLLS